MRDRISITVDCTTVGGRALEQPWVRVGECVCVSLVGSGLRGVIRVDGIIWWSEWSLKV